MMAWILVSLLAGYASGAVVALSPDATGAQASDDANGGFQGEAPDDGFIPPPKP